MGRSTRTKGSRGFFAKLFGSIFSASSPLKSNSRAGKGNGTSSRRLRFEGVEDRRLLSVSVGWGGALPVGVLQLTGNGGSDSVAVLGRSSYVDIFVNNNFQVRLQTANATNVHQIRFTDSGGADSLKVQDIQTTGTLALGSVGNELSGLENLTVVNGKNVTVNNGANALNFGTSKFTGALTVRTAGAITQNGAVSVTGLTRLVATAGDITLMNAANNFATMEIDANTGAQNVSIADVNAIQFVDSLADPDSIAAEVGGNLTVVANNNSTNRVAISQTAALVVGGSTSLAAGSASTITLNGNNLLGDGVGIDTLSVTTANATLRNTAALVTTLGASKVTGNLTVTATGGGIAESGNVVVGKTATFTAVGNNIVLDTVAANNFTTFAATGSTVSVADLNSVVLGNITAGNLSVTTNGVISQSGTVAVSGATTLDAGSVNDITLTKSTNNFKIVDIVSGDDVSLRDANAIRLSSDATDSTVSGNLAVTAGGVIDQGLGNLLVTAGKTTLKGTAITLDNAGNDFNEVGVTSGTTVSLRDTNELILAAAKISGALTVQVGGELTQSGALSVKSNTTTLIAGAANDITLDNSGNDFLRVAVTSGNNVSLRDLNAVILGDAAISGALDIQANLNSSDRLAISQVPAALLTVAGSTTLEAGSRSTIKLDNATNDFDLGGSGGVVAVISGANATLVDANAIVLGPTTLTGNLAVTSGGAVGDTITQSGPVVVAKTTTLSANLADVVLSDADNDFNALAVVDGAAIQINDSNAITLGAVGSLAPLVSFNLTADGAVTQTGALEATSAVFDVGAANDVVLLNAANSLTSIGIDSARNVSLRNSGPLSLEDVAIAGTLDINASGDVDQAAPANMLDVGGKTTLTVPTTANVTLDNSGNNLGEVAVTSAGNVSLQNGDALVLGASTISGNLTVALENTASGGLTQSGAVRVTGTASFDADVQDIELTNSANNFASLIVVNAGNANLRDINAIQLGVAGTGGVNVAGNLEITVGGAITDDGALTIGGLTTLTTSASADITLDTAVNAFTGAVSVISAKNVAIDATGGLILGASNVSGTLGVTLAGVGNLTQSGPIVVAGTTTLAVLATNDIDLTNAANNFATVSVTNARNVSLKDSGDVDLGAMAIAGALSVTANGSITDSGLVTVALTTTLEADADGSGVGDITLNSASSYTGKLTVLGGVNVAIANSIATILGDTYAIGDLTITGTGTLTNFDGATYGILNVVGNATLDVGPAGTLNLRQTGWTYGSLLLLGGTVNDI